MASRYQRHCRVSDRPETTHSKQSAAPRLSAYNSVVQFQAGEIIQRPLSLVLSALTPELFFTMFALRRTMATLAPHAASSLKQAGKVVCIGRNYA